MRGGNFAADATFFRVKCLVREEKGVLVRAKVDLEILRGKMSIVSYLMYCELIVGMECMGSRAKLDSNGKTGGMLTWKERRREDGEALAVEKEILNEGMDISLVTLTLTQRFPIPRSPIPGYSSAGVKLPHYHSHLSAKALAPTLSARIVLFRSQLDSGMMR